MAHPADTSILATVDDALRAADWITPADQPTVELLRRLANRLDDAGTVELLRRLAARLDDPDFPVIDGRFDNVSESLFLKTAAALGLTPEMRAAWAKKEKKVDGGRLETLRKGTAGLRAV